MKSKRRKRKIVPYRRRFHLNIGIIIFAFVFIYFVIYLISYLTQNNIAVYEVQYGQIAKNKSYTDRKSTRLNSSHRLESRMPSSA